MTGYLVDTSVLSAFAPGRPRVQPELEGWFRSKAGLYLSMMTIIEVEEGIAKLRRQATTVRADALARWIATTMERFERKVLGIDLALAAAIGRLSDRARAIGRHPGLPDVIIAATAQAHGLVVLTHNLRHFAPLGIDVVDPFASLPP